MIIWISSYPKSGNTWVRSIISSLIYSHDGLFNFELLKRIPQYPKKKYFENFTDKFQNVHELKKYWLASQDLINSDKKIKFFKTHHINCKIGEYAFTNKKNTLATIYIVRDPRNLINSFANHYGMDKNSAKKFISSPQSVSGAIGRMNKQNNIFTILGSWKDHYISWTKMNSNLLILKYEDLLLDPYKEIEKIIKFLKNIISFKYDMQKIQNILNSTSFEALKKMEIDQGFNEAATDKTTLKKVNFFNLGKDNKWEQYLVKDEIDYLLDKFGLEMKELGYD
jgi:hypothetical protein